MDVDIPEMNWVLVLVVSISFELSAKTIKINKGFPAQQATFTVQLLVPGGKNLFTS